MEDTEINCVFLFSFYIRNIFIVVFYIKVLVLEQPQILRICAHLWVELVKSTFTLSLFS